MSTEPAPEASTDPRPRVEVVAPARPPLRAILWSWFKPALAIVVLFFVGRTFWRDIEQVDFATLTIRPEWLACSAGLYLLGISTSGWYWHRLLDRFGMKAPVKPTVQAFFAGHVAKYVPGKAWALLARASFLRPVGVRTAVTIITSFYEVLTTMAAGALVASILFVVQPPEIEGLPVRPWMAGILLLGACGLPLAPPVFNFVAERMARRFSYVEELELPRLRMAVLVEGLAITGVGWALIGLSTGAMLQAVLPEPPSWLESWPACTSAIGLAYVAGFAAVFVPGGVGVREWILLALLASTGPEGLVATAILLLRLLWVAVEALGALVALSAGGSPPSPT